MIKIDSQRGKNPELPYKKSEVLPKDLLPIYWSQIKFVSNL